MPTKRKSPKTAKPNRRRGKRMEPASGCQARIIKWEPR